VERYERIRQNLAMPYSVGIGTTSLKYPVQMPYANYKLIIEHISWIAMNRGHFLQLAIAFLIDEVSFDKTKHRRYDASSTCCF
jgi:hypothetical protein